MAIAHVSISSEFMRWTDVRRAGAGKSNFLCMTWYGGPASLYPRARRLTFAEACHLL
jgi:hypothetical protein